MAYICVYGSLRNDEYNFNSYLKEYGNKNIQYVSTTILNGYELYSLDSYPGIKESTEDKQLTVDILKVSNDVYLDIYDMEVCAGYSPKQVKLLGMNMTIFIYNGYTTKRNLVESGDWSKHLKELV